MSEAKQRKPREPKPLPLLPMSTSRDALALQAELNEARNMLASAGEDEARTTPGLVAARAMSAGLRVEAQRLEMAIRKLGFIPEPDPLHQPEAAPDRAEGGGQ